MVAHTAGLDRIEDGITPYVVEYRWRYQHAPSNAYEWSEWKRYATSERKDWAKIMLAEAMQCLQDEDKDYQVRVR